MDSLISIIIPTRNRVKYLSWVLPSYFNQSFVEEIVIIDDGSTDKTSSYLTQLAKKLSMGNKVYFVGQVGQADLPKYYNIADVFVLASTYYDHNGKYIPYISENFGLVLAEAMACKVPVVASNMGGIPYWVKDNYNGLLCTERNIEESANFISRVLNDYDLRNKLISNAYKEITENYSLNAVIKQYMKLYRQ